MHTQTQTAIEQVEMSNQEHHDNIIAFARVWLCDRMKAFTSEDFKADYYEAGNEPPREPRVFGSVFNQLRKEGLISTENRFKVSDNPICHGRPQRIWLSRSFQIKQQQNRMMNSKTQVKLFTL